MASQESDAVKASVPKLFFCPGSASYTPVTQGSRWRVASRQLRKPTTPSALAFFVVDRAPSGFPFGCAVQNPITPFAQTLPTRPLFPQNTAPQTLSPTALTLQITSRLPRAKPIQRRNKAKQRRAQTDPGGGKDQFRAGKARSSGSQRPQRRRKRRGLSAGKHSEIVLGFCGARQSRGEQSGSWGAKPETRRQKPGGRQVLGRRKQMQAAKAVDLRQAGPKRHKNAAYSWAGR